jgi:tRNA (cytidine/uridine-2'-O-)-methyltransferase
MRVRHTHTRRGDLPFHWPDPPLHVVLVEPEIPPNTGNVARLCAATGCRLHLIEPMGFKITDARLKRAGLDDWDSIHPEVHHTFEFFRDAVRPSRLLLFSTAATVSYLDAKFAPGDALVFGPETRGLSDEMLHRYRDSVYGIPIRTEHVRSLNLSTATGIVTYEALRQIHLGSPLRRHAGAPGTSPCEQGV